MLIDESELLGMLNVLPRQDRPADINPMRLLKLADHLEKLPPRLWDNRAWAIKIGKEIVGSHVCGPFRSEGFWYEWSEQDLSQSALFGGPRDIQIVGTPVIGKLIGWEAVESWYGLDAHGASHLFHSTSYPTPRTPLLVAARIRQMVEAIIPY